MHSAVARYPDEAVVGSGPDDVSIEIRRPDAEDLAAVRSLRKLRLRKRAQARRFSGIRAREVRAYRAPLPSAVRSRKLAFRPEVRGALAGEAEADRRRAVQAVFPLIVGE